MSISKGRYSPASLGNLQQLTNIMKIFFFPLVLTVLQIPIYHYFNSVTMHLQKDPSSISLIISDKVREKSKNCLFSKLNRLSLLSFLYGEFFSLPTISSLLVASLEHANVLLVLGRPILDTVLHVSYEKWTEEKDEQQFHS